jgi:hypothetical protein
MTVTTKNREDSAAGVAYRLAQRLDVSTTAEGLCRKGTGPRPVPHRGLNVALLALPSHFRHSRATLDQQLPQLCPSRICSSEGGGDRQSRVGQGVENALDVETDQPIAGIGAD